ncbi:MAG: hypothetical protein QW754_05695 [Thermoplasmata archaeon]
MSDKFKVKSITLKTKLTNEGNFIDVYEIKFITKSGIESKIDIIKDEFDEKKVAEILDKEANKLETIFNL